MILHLIVYEKFTEDYIKRINRLFGEKEHLFLVFGEKTKSDIRSIHSKNVVFSVDFKSKIYCALFLIIRILLCKKVIIHALFLSNTYLKILILLQPTSKDKYYWNMWGYDLYNAYRDREKFPKREKLRIRFIKNLKAVGCIPGDYEFLKEKYETNARFYLASYTYDFYENNRTNIENSNNIVNILLGNSATEECQYEEIIDLLSNYRNKKFLVKCILSYPEENEEYRKKIINYGLSKLGERFIPITDFLSYERYMELLSQIDIAIFNHNRQQAIGNISNLLYLGKKIYINPLNRNKEFFEQMGAKIYTVKDFSEKDICKTSFDNISDINRKAINDFFSDEQFKDRWGRIFFERY